MLILAFETSAKAASVALMDGGKLLGEGYQNTGLTHSQTLMVMAEDVLKQCGRTAQDVQGVAVAEGPGSFTGVRIGVAAAKGFAWGREIPCYGVSTLEAMAESLGVYQGYVCACMDARRSQVYNALFYVDNGVVERRTEDRAISLADLAEEVKKYENDKIVVGDGAKLCYNTLSEMGLSLTLAPEHLRMQSGWGVARAAEELAKRGELIRGEALNAIYHRLSQAERERMEKQKNT